MKKCGRSCGCYYCDGIVVGGGVVMDGIVVDDKR